MMYHFETIPPWKMPDDEIIQNHEHHVFLRIDFNIDHDVYHTMVGDLSKYYDWAKENGVFMEHNILRQGKDGKRSTVMFVFKNAIDAMGFKLSWKEYGIRG